MRGSGPYRGTFPAPVGITPPPHPSFSDRVRYDNWLPPHRNFLPRRATKLNGEAIISTAKKIFARHRNFLPGQAPATKLDTMPTSQNAMWARSCRDRSQFGGPPWSPPIFVGRSQVTQLCFLAVRVTFCHWCTALRGVPFGHSIIMPFYSGMCFPTWFYFPPP